MKKFVNINLLLIAILMLLLNTSVLSQTEIWSETFDTPDKGYWGGGSDLAGVTWTLDVSACTLSNATDYIKTVSTGDSRMEARDIDGEAVWTSEDITIAGYTNVSISAKLGRTGGGTTAENKYVKIFYKIDSQAEQEIGSLSVSGNNSKDVNVSGLSGNTLKIIAKLNNTYAGDKIYFDDVKVEGTLSGSNDNDSELSAGDNSEPSSISSTMDTEAESLQVLDFKFTDKASGDNKATIINSLKITQGANNQAADWTNVVGGTKIYMGATEIAATTSINADNLNFTFTTPISIADGSNETYSLKIFLKNDLSSIDDNDNLDFKLNYSDIVTDASGSSFGSGSVSSGAVSVTVVSTKLLFSNLNTAVIVNNDFGVTVQATDENGNLDTDFTDQVTLSKSTGSGTLTSASSLSQAATAGEASWTDLRYDTGDTFNIQASATGLTSVTSSDITAIIGTSSIDDDFEDGNLDGWLNTSDWTNSNENSISGTNSLKHNISEGQGGSYISHDLQNLDLNSKPVVWRFNLKNGSWDPTTQNRFWFYLLANESNLLSDTVDGYAVGVQLNASGSKDSLTLWKVTDGDVYSALITSNFDWGSNDAVGIKVERNTTGEWSLTYYENTDFSSPQFAGTAINTDYTFHDYCGLVFKFEGSTSRAGELWLDDLTVGLDTIAPEISKLKVLNDSTLVVDFSEIVNEVSAENVDNYVVEGFGKATNAILSDSKNSVILYFDKKFEAGTKYLLSVENIKDISENTIANGTKDFVYIPFVVENLYVVSKNEIVLEFTHKLETSTASNTDNFIINNDIGKPLSIEFISDSVLRLMVKELSDTVKYTLGVSNVKSREDILMQAQDVDFEYYPGNTFDVVINEIMSDVSPAPAVLPNFKYIELYNRSEHSIDLSGWKIQLGTKTPKNFERFIIKPKSYLLLCASKHKDDFDQYGDIMGVISESNLSSSGTQITITNSEGILIDYANYSTDWYSDDTKKSGGWSLEKIDSDNFCGAENNWQASKDYRGGTPGMLNSAAKANPDTVEFKLLNNNLLTPFKVALTFSKNLEEIQALNPENYELNKSDKPLFVNFSDTSKATVILQFATQFVSGKQNTLTISNLQDFCSNAIEQTSISFKYFLIYPISAFAEESNFVKIIFSEEVDKVTAQNIDNYMVDKGMGKPKTAYKHTVNRKEVFLEFANDFKNQTKYKLSVKNVKDLYGNAIKDADIEFVYFVPSNNDLVINEILFNPKPNGVDFVEIYNKSKLSVDLSKMFIARRDETGEIESKKQLSSSNNMLEPNVFLCISSDTAKTKLDYPAASYEQFLQIPTLPSYNDDKGDVVLMYGESIIDEFSYNEKMHFALITKDDGVSLERIDPFKPSNDPDNWHSAASTVGFATPANKNSQYKMLAQDIDKDVVVEPETFSPNNDGHEDLVFIRYKFPKPGYVANVNIYDSKGRLIKRIAKNALLSNEGEFSWDGLHEDRKKAGIGIYVIHFEVFNLEGVVKQTKKVCVLGRGE